MSMSSSRQNNKKKIVTRITKNVVDPANRPQELTAQERVRSDQVSSARMSSLPPAIITGVRFSVMSSTDIQSVSVANVTKPTCSRSSNDMSECDNNTPLDPYMGKIDKRYQCKTCHQLLEKCPFHFGSIDLKEKKCYNPMFKNYIMQCLKCLCFNCNRLKIDDSTFEHYKFDKKKGVNRLKHLAELSVKISQCSWCKTEQKNLEFNKFKDENIIIGVSNKNRETHYSVGDVLNIFEKLSDDTVRKLGFIKGRPENFIIKNLLVIPPASRPNSYTNSAGQLQEDGMTKQYSDIVKQVMDPSHGVQSGHHSRNQVYGEIAELFEHKKTRMILTRSKSNRGNFWIKILIDGKKGVVRYSMMGKRRNDTFRTVLAAGPDLEYGELGVPEAIKEFITVTETVSSSTYNNVIKMFGTSVADCQIKRFCPSSGESRGVNMKVIEKSSNNSKNANTWSKCRDSIAPGDTYERYLKDGDPVLFNRQPTLGADSMTGYLMKFQEGLCIRVHLGNTPSLNADFDGDEGNGIIAQTLGMKLELLTFNNTRHRIISPNTGAPSVGVVFNGLAGGYLLTQVDVMLSKNIWDNGYKIAQCPQGQFGSPEFENFSSRCSDMNIDILSGRGLFSSLLPENFYYKKNSGTNAVIIKRGILINGFLEKPHIGRERDSIIQALYNSHGQIVTNKFITRVYFLFDWYLEIRGLTLSIFDCCFVGQKYIEMIRIREEAVKETQNKVYKLNSSFIKPSEFEQRYIDAQTVAYADDTRNTMTKFVNDNLKSDNPLRIMINSGARGKELNLVQTSAMMGQQLMFGSRPANGISNGQRILPYFNMNSEDLYANGFCSHSFTEGLNPTEMYFHWMASRISSMDSGINVPVTGSIQRRMIKAMEDVILAPDCSVINTVGSEFSPIYSDGFNPVHMVRSKGPLTGDLKCFIDLETTITKLNDEFEMGKI